MLFLLLHLAGVSLALLQPQAFEAYATALHQSPWLLPAEGLLSAALLGHLGLTAWKLVAKRQAGNRSVLVSRRADRWGAWAARSLPVRPSVPVLAGLLVEASHEGLVLSTFDYETSARATLHAEVSGGSGAGLRPAARRP